MLQVKIFIHFPKKLKRSEFNLNTSNPSTINAMSLSCSSLFNFHTLSMDKKVRMFTYMFGCYWLFIIFLFILDDSVSRVSNT